FGQMKSVYGHTQCIELLQASYPALWSLGDYAPDKDTGPAVWLRYQLEMQDRESVPVIYLPGVGRSAFRYTFKPPPPDIPNPLKRHLPIHYVAYPMC
ncbi:MAG: hypothetical protein ABIJ42_03955, partial [Acidobacteriota bacterium]